MSYQVLNLQRKLEKLRKTRKRRVSSYLAQKSTTSISNKYIWIAATLAYSIAEVILVPSLNIKIDQLTTSTFKSSYFSIAYLYRIGCGALIGGAVLDYFGGMVLYLSMALICLTVMCLFKLADNHT
jgi:predicted MFS family arabinose efflux permease